MNAIPPAAAPAAIINPLLLVVDDDDLARQLLARLLNLAGYETVEVRSGEAALDYLEQHSVQGVLMDVRMPGLDGYEVCRRLRQGPATASIPVLLLTALVDLDSLRRGAEAGVNQVIQKPADFKELVKLLESLVRAKPPVPPPPAAPGDLAAYSPPVG